MESKGESMERILKLLMWIRTVNADDGLTCARCMNSTMDCLRPKNQIIVQLLNQAFHLVNTHVRMI